MDKATQPSESDEEETIEETDVPENPDSTVDSKHPVKFI